MCRTQPTAARQLRRGAALRGVALCGVLAALFNVGCADSNEPHGAGLTSATASTTSQDAALPDDSATADADAADGSASDADLLDAGAAAPDAEVDLDASTALDAAHPGVVPGVQAVGLMASLPQLLDAGTPTKNLEAEAEFEVLALGSRAVWFEVLPSSALGLSKLEQNEGVYRETGVRLLVNIPLREVAVGELLDAEALTAQTTIYQSLLTAIFAAPVRPDYITFGSALDVTLASLDTEKRTAFEAWVTSLVRYAKTARGDRLIRMGISGSAQGWLRSSTEFSRLAGEGDIAAASWLVVSADGQALAPEAAISELDVLVAAADAKHLPLVLQDVGYPSSSEVGSSEQQQAAFFGAFFEQLARYPKRVPYVCLSALNEYAESACDTYADTFGLPKSAALARCSVGLRRRDATQKPAYQTVAEGLVRFSSL